MIPLEGRLVEVNPSSWRVRGDLGPIWGHQIGNRVTLTRPGDPLTGRSERSGPYKSFRNVYLSPLSNEIAFLAYGIRDEVEILMQYLFVDVDAALLSWKVDVVEGFEPLFIRLGEKILSIRHIPVGAVELEPRFDPGIVIRPVNFPYDRRGVPCYDAWTVFEPR